MTIAQTDQRLFKGSTAEILAFMPPSFDGWTYAESTDDNSAYRWNSTTSLWEQIGAVPNLAAVLVVGNKSGPNSILLRPAQSLDTDPPVPLPVAPNVPSNAGLQYSTTFASRAQVRLNQFGVNAGVPGISAFKSRGPTVGDLAGVVDADILFQVAAAGVAPNPPNNSLPLAGLIGIVVPTGGSVPGNNWVAADFEIQLVPLEGPINGRKRVFKLTSHGIPCLREIAAVTAPNTGKAAGLVALWRWGLAVCF
jgi:hypothetical protein